MTTHVRRSLLPVFAFTGAFLMFMLEPLVGRILLPAYGGSFHVWTTCLMFFQGALLAGYLYAHFVAPRIGRWHLVVACAPLALLPIELAPVPDPASPILSIIGVLTTRIAIPFAVLSTTGVIAQTWFAASRDHRRSDPYWLYAASNAGSLLGLLAYPFLVEPWLGVTAQRWTWSACYLVYLALAAAVAPRDFRRTVVVESAHPGADSGSTPAMAAWFGLSTATSMMLMAVTNALSFDVGSIPLVWVAPLALYLATFVLIFGKRPIYPRMLATYWPEAALAGLVALAAAPLLPSWPRIGMHLLALFATCMAAHAELHRLRPQPAGLTKYYVVMSIGGWAGGVFVSIAAPALFDRLLEYPLAIALVGGSLLLLRRFRAAETLRSAPVFGLQTAVRTPIAVTGLALVLAWLGATGASPARLMLLRNHYGVYQVGDTVQPGGDATATGNAKSDTVRQIVHNGTTHGAQVMESEQRHMPIGYYHRASGLADVISTLAHPYKLGVVGLGAGATAAYLESGDEITFYEIDPDDETLARRWFTYLDDCYGKARVVIGDARLTLAADAEAPDGIFDMFLVDAFSGDAIPTHLLTLEALELYTRKLRPGGLLLFHITNRFYDLRPVLEAARRGLGLHAAYKVRPDNELQPLERHTVYWTMSSDAHAIERLVAHGWKRTDSGADAVRPTTLWTDDYVNALAPLWRGMTANEKR